MFDPLHNAVDHFYAVNGPLKGSWKGLDKGIGIVNWNGGLMGKNCQFFADLGLKQILSGYYDGDEDGAGITKWIDEHAATFPASSARCTRPGKTTTTPWTPGRKKPGAANHVRGPEGRRGNNVLSNVADKPFRMF